MSSIYYITKDSTIARCTKLSIDCDHSHYLYLASAAREVAKKFKREYHLSSQGEIELCQDPSNCALGVHYLQRREVVTAHKNNFDFSGPYRALENPYVSLLEGELASFVERLGFEVVYNSRKIIHPYEIDLYFPGLKACVEFNGDYWHSEEKILERYGKSSLEYHLRKHDLCDNQGLRLAFVWESNWKQDWVTVVDALSDFLQFGSSSPVLRSFEKPLSPAELHWESIDREGFEKSREKISHRKIKKLLKSSSETSKN